MVAVVKALGLMSGTSLDGIDAAVIRSDGETFCEPGPGLTVPYDEPLRETLRQCLRPATRPLDIAPVVQALTDAHAAVVSKALEELQVNIRDLTVIGFHGHTIDHQPQAGRTWQIGDGARLARATGVAVVNDFRSADVLAGGQGAPLVPLYHRVLASKLDKPVAIVNVGGVANVTWVGNDDRLMAFDTGPGNAPLDDWMRARAGLAYDPEGQHAGRGRVHEDRLVGFLAQPYFARRPPKSLDRHDLNVAVDGLSAEDGAATIVEAMAHSIVQARQHFPEPARTWLITGGGRHNRTLLARLERLLDSVRPVEAVGWRGDLLEAQAFAYLAIRRLRALPTSLPETTGCRTPTVGGTLWPI
jgi:anhydro-N-acetylmuramic acid kinase